MLRDSLTPSHHGVKCNVNKGAVLYPPSSGFCLLPVSRFSLAPNHTIQGWGGGHLEPLYKSRKLKCDRVVILKDGYSTFYSAFNSDGICQNKQQHSR